MTNHCQDHDCRNSNSGFIFGLLCGAIIGAIIAVVIYKNNKTDVFEKFYKKIKDYFNNLNKTNKKTPKVKKTTNKKKVTSPKNLISSPEFPKKEITPIFVKSKKQTPKTFIKSKKV